MFDPRIDIAYLFNRFGALIDSRGWSVEAFRALFDEKVRYDYSDMGVPVAHLSPHEIVELVAQTFKGFKATQHAVFGHIVDLTENTALCRANVRSVHYLPNDTVDEFLEDGGYYTAIVVSTPGGWRIREWKFTELWYRGNRDLFQIAAQ